MDLTLTKAEEKVMKILWSIGKGLIREIVEHYDEPKPAYTTVATIIKILEKKGFVERKPVANSFEYRPLVEKSDYTVGVTKSLIKNYFSNSFKDLVSEFSKKQDMTTEEMEDIIAHLNKSIKDKKAE